VFGLRDGVDAIMMIEGVDPGRAESFIHDVEKYLSNNPGAIVVHRVNECDRRKGTDHVDTRLRETNRVARRTVFISQWLKDYHHWNVQAQSVIRNGCDEAVFFPGPAWDKVAPFRIVTHHWSPNWNKGFRAYQVVDEAIADGVLKDVTLTVIGQWPMECQWRAARLISPLWGAQLAEELRRHHAYITGSLWEPGGMHHVEAAACGLPVAYHKNGGGIVEMCSRYGVAFSDDPVEAIHFLKERYTELREKVLDHVPSLSATLMCESYAKILLCE
jgi:glycosyltransferase involved in cell wall biosynthesis